MPSLRLAGPPLADVRREGWLGQVIVAKQAVKSPNYQVRH